MSYIHRHWHSTAQLDYAFATFQGAVHYIANDLSKQFGVARSTERRRSTHLVRVTTPSNCVINIFSTFHQKAQLCFCTKGDKIRLSKVFEEVTELRI